MKRVLMATAALCLGAGTTAMAQDMEEMSMSSVTVGGDGRMGVVFDDDENAKFSSRVRVSFTLAAALDGGMTAGGSIRADNAPGGAAGTAGSVFLEGSFGKLAMGDVDPGAKADLSFGDIGTAWLGAGFEGAPGDGDGHLMVGAGASVSGFTGKLLVGTRDDNNQYAVSAGYSAGVIGATVFYADDTEMGDADGEALGVGLEWSIGGGAAIKGGVVNNIGQNGADDTRKADLGVTFSF